MVSKGQMSGKKKLCFIQTYSQTEPEWKDSLSFSFLFCEGIRSTWLLDPPPTYLITSAGRVRTHSVLSAGVVFLFLR